VDGRCRALTDVGYYLGVCYRASKNRSKSQSRWLISGPGFESETSRIRSRILLTKIWLRRLRRKISPRAHGRNTHEDATKCKILDGKRKEKAYLEDLGADRNMLHRILNKHCAPGLD
jgi:hypothetical protein